MVADQPSLELMRLAAAGDAIAFSELVRRHTPAIHRMSYLLLHSSAEAEDVVQETFAAALERMDQFRGEGEPGGWFYAIALNLCRRRLREEKRRDQLVDSARHMRMERRGVLTSALRRETARKLALALGYLTEEQREVFVLHYVEELPYEEISGILGVTPEAARALAHRARVALRERLPELDVN